MTDADSQAAVIRKALAVYEFLCVEMQKGARVLIRTEDSEKEVVII